MAVNENRIVKVTTNLFKGGTTPASNTYLTLTNGVPTNGAIHCGAIGSIGVSPGVEVAEKDSENQIATLGASISKHTMEITVRLREWTTEGLSWLMAGRRVGAGFFGGGTTQLEYAPLTVVWGLDEDAGLYAFFHAYKCYVSSPASLDPNKSDNTELEATFTAVADTTRDRNDPLYQLWCPEGYRDLM